MHPHLVYTLRGACVARIGRVQLPSSLSPASVSRSIADTMSTRRHSGCLGFRKDTRLLRGGLDLKHFQSPLTNACSDVIHFSVRLSPKLKTENTAKRASGYVMDTLLSTTTAKTKASSCLCSSTTKSDKNARLQYRLRDSREK